MDTNLILIISLCFIVSILLTWFIVSWNANKKITAYKSITEAIAVAEKELLVLKDELGQTKEEFDKTDAETKELQELKKNADAIETQLASNKDELDTVISVIDKMAEETEIRKDELHDIMAKLDLYNRLDDFVDHGHFEIPEYLHETSLRFAEEIKRIRQKQKDLIKEKTAIRYPDSTIISNDKSYNKKILDGQVKLMLSAFNIECDTLIGKVSPSSFPRTLERIEKLFGNLEKSAATLHCGFDIKYVELKYEECRLQYQHKLKKQEEQEEQRQIREQIREEQKAIKEYERAVAQAKKEEQMYRDMLTKAREELGNASEQDRIIAEQRILDLERQLAEAEANEERAKSMAEQTRRGHVYVISNIGSFGENVYKIGLTRRLEPMDRVKELGDASVPFTFDVHAMIYVDDAPALERALHQEFTASRVNAVNFRKEFFRTDLHSIKKAAERIAGVDVEFKMTILAEEYYETRRLQGLETSAA